MKWKAAQFGPFLLMLTIAASGCSTKEAQPPAAQPAATPVAVASAPPATAAAAPAAAPAAAAAGPPALASADGEKPGIRIDVTELKRASGGTVNLKMVMINDSDTAHSFGYDYGDGSQGATDYNAIGGVHLIDPVGKKKYFVARDSENKCVCSTGVKEVPARGRINLWAKFPAPPEDVQKIGVVIPHFPPLDDVPLGR
jgi:hypothetical protein